MYMCVCIYMYVCVVFHVCVFRIAFNLVLIVFTTLYSLRPQRNCTRSVPLYILLVVVVVSLYIYTIVIPKGAVHSLFRCFFVQFLYVPLYVSPFLYFFIYVCFYFMLIIIISSFGSVTDSR